MVQRITRLPQIPDDGQWYHLLGYISDCSLRDRLMLALAYHGALRRTEVTTITIEDIDPAHRLIRIRAETLKANANGWSATARRLRRYWQHISGT